MPVRILTVAVGLLIMLTGTLSGCAGKVAPGEELPLPAAEGRGVLERWRQREGTLHSLQGLAKVRIKTPGGTVNGSQAMAAAMPDRLRVEILSPFGTPLVSLATDGQQLQVFLPGENLFYTGTATADNLARFSRVPLPPGTLVAMLLWQPPLLAFRELTAFGVAGGGWRLQLEAGALRQELTFDAAERLQSARYFSGDSVQLQVTYAEFDPVTGTPRQLGLEQPPARLVATLHLSEVSVNQALPVAGFSLQPPAGARVVPLEPPAATDPVAEPMQPPAAEGR